MFLIDDLLLSPMKGLLGIFRQIHDTAKEELAGEGKAITAALSELYMKLETGQVTEVEFEAQEKTLLDRLDRLQAEEESSPEPEASPVRRRPKARGAKKKPSPEKSAAII